jgi:cytochrome oxidase Cu insertion factor (SCO1/SenC/PrrC family)
LIAERDNTIVERLLHPRVLAALGLLNALLVGLLGYSGWQLAHPTAPLDDFGPAPAFTLTDQLGRPVDSATLRDRVVLVDFIYTRCRDTCPLLSARMGALQDRLRQEKLLGDRVQLLSLTVDPAHDTPAVLRAYAERHQADPAAWRFLSGSPDVITPVIVQGFFQGVVTLPEPEPGAAADGEPTGLVMHSNHFVLIDAQGRMRAFYDGLALDPDQVVRDIRRVGR